MEFSAHEVISKALGVEVFFTDPYSSWQKWAIENANGLIRQYIPKRASFDEYDDKDIRTLLYFLPLNSTHKCNLSVRPVYSSKLEKKYSRGVRKPSFPLVHLISVSPSLLLSMTLLPLLQIKDKQHILVALSL